MTSALIGLALIVLIALITVVLGALTRLLAARIIATRQHGHAPLSPLDRVALGNEIIARDLQPDDTHPVARTDPRNSQTAWADGPLQRQDLTVRYPGIAAHALR